MTMAPPVYEDQITFTIPTRHSFSSLKKSDISTEEVECVSSTEVPSFLQTFRDDLARKRLIPSNVSAAATSPLFTSIFSRPT